MGVVRLHDAEFGGQLLSAFDCALDQLVVQGQRVNDVQERAAVVFCYFCFPEALDDGIEVVGDVM